MNVSNNLDPLRVKEDLKVRGETQAIKCIEGLQESMVRQHKLFGELMTKHREQAKALSELEKDYIALAKKHAAITGEPVITAEQEPWVKKLKSMNRDIRHD
jgi:ABC-type branched-subunit amino acid transport system ATPase component